LARYGAIPVPEPQNSPTSMAPPIAIIQTWQAVMPRWQPSSGWGVGGLA
jgi:hypothetical protein